MEAPKNTTTKIMFPMNSVHLSLKENSMFKKNYTTKDGALVPIDQLAFKTLFNAAQSACNICIKQQYNQSTDSNSTQGQVNYSKELYSKIQQLSDNVLKKLGEPILIYTQQTRKIIDHEERIQQILFSIENDISSFIKKHKIFSEMDLALCIEQQEIQQIVDKANSACNRLKNDGVFENDISFTVQKEPGSGFSIKYKTPDGETEIIEVTDVKQKLQDILGQVKEKIQTVSSSITQRKNLLIDILKKANVNDIQSFHSLMQKIQSQVQNIPTEQLNKEINIPEERQDDIDYLKKKLKDYYQSTVSLEKQKEQYEEEINKMKKREYDVKVREKDQEALIQQLKYTKDKLKEKSKYFNEQTNDLLTTFQNKKDEYEKIIQEQNNSITTSQTAQKVGITTSAIAIGGIASVFFGNKFYPEQFDKIVNAIILAVVIVLMLATIIAFSKTVKNTRQINNEQPTVSTEQESLSK